MRHTYYDFFAGGGMAGFGLGAEWECLFANDIDPVKGATYRRNHDGGRELVVKDVASVAVEELPGTADLAWASFPCQDLSLAGRGAGLGGTRSGMFEPFRDLVRGLLAEGRGPRIVALENVCGAITSRGGRDFATLVGAFADLGYRCGAVVVDAVRFLPQSRPRLFVVGVRGDLTIPASVVRDGPSPLWHPPALVASQARARSVGERWRWWNPPAPGARPVTLGCVIEADPRGANWHSRAQTDRLLALMSDRHRDKVEAAMATGAPAVGFVYRRTRLEANGDRRQRAEVRFDGIAGCLRTPSGGSSRQTILLVEGRDVRSRLLSAREAASLMGLPASYALPERYNDAYRLAGDGVAAPVVRHLAASIFEPILACNRLALVA